MNSKEQVWKVGALVGMILALFLVVVTIKEIKSIGYVGKDTPVFNSISVNGKGEEIVIPDIATFSFGVTEKAKTVAEAQKKATDKLNKTFDVIRGGGVQDKDIQTLSYSINPSYEYIQGVCTQWSCGPSKQNLIGYEVSQVIQIKVRDIEKSGDILASIGSMEVENVSGLSFSVDNIDAIKSTARAKAILDAKAKAEKLSKDLGVKIVRITSFYDNSDQPWPMYGMGGDMMMAKAESAPVRAPEIPTGEQKVTANVSITYEIK